MATRLAFPLIALIAFITFLSLPPRIPVSPLGIPLTPSSSNQDQNTYLILGFAPYWNLKKITPVAIDNITHFGYFNLHLNGDGSIYTQVNKREEDPGYTNYKRLIAGTVDHGHKPLIITFMPESQSALSESIASASSRQKTIKTIIGVVLESQAGGVNIDYEPLGDTPLSTRDNFTLFIKELRSSLCPSPKALCPLLTISIYASSSSRPRLWDLTSLNQVVDYFIVMTYDYTMPLSDTAGPNAPLRGSGQLFEHDIVKNIAEITRVVESRKILLGIPFYGYEWDTTGTEKYSPATSRGSVASLERIDEMIKAKTLELIWDRNTLTPYGIASDSGKTTQIYFENITSIKLKLEFVKSANLGGIAVWALGYEGNNPGLWTEISSTLH